MTYLNKKMKKLIKTPAKFFLDSKFVPLAIKNIIIKKPPPIEQVKSLEKKSPQPDLNVKNTVTTLPVVNDIIVAATGWIIFPLLSDKNADKRAAIFYSEENKIAAEKIISFCKGFTDFKPLREGELVHGSYNVEEKDYSSLINRIDLSNKQKLSKIKNIFFIGNDDTFARAVRTVNCDINVFYIDLNPHRTKNYSPDLDGYIIQRLDSHTLQRKNYFKNNIRNAIQTENSEMTALAIRKFVQDNLPKDIDLPLPVISDTTFLPELASYDTQNYSVFLKLKKDSWVFQGVTHINLCERLAQCTDSLFVCESVYMKYKNLLVTPTQNTLKHFYLLATKDGIRFDVKH